VALGAQGERAQATQDQEAVEWTRHGPNRVLQEAQPLGHGRPACDHDPVDRVGVAAEVLRGRVEDDVRAVIERSLDRRRRERVVDHQQWPLTVGPAMRRDHVGHTGDIHELEERIGRGLEPDEPCVR
jgi:hypothetical protein